MKFPGAIAAAILGMTGVNAISTRQADGRPRVHGEVEVTVKNADFSNAKLGESYVTIRNLDVPQVRTAKVKSEDKANWQFNSETATVYMYGDEMLEVDVTEPSTFSDDNWIGYITADQILSAKGETKTIAVDMNDLGTVNVDIKYTPLDDIKLTGAMPNTYFDEQKCTDEVRLYADAHVTKELADKGGHGTWDDLYADLQKAEHFIYATGWAIWKDLRMVRPDGMTTEELLKKKASEGVQVVLMPWGNLAESVLATYDNELAKAFADVPNVTVVRPGRRKGVCRKEFNAVGPNFSHHQKTIMLDIGGELIAYTGGLDITQGRYDDQSHPLFRQGTADDEVDYMQYTIPKPLYGTDPREPWHDIHMRMTNKGALDIYNNFKDRMTAEKAAKTKNAEIIDSLYDVEGLPKLQGACPYTNKWHTQVVRSIDTSSAIFPRGTKTLSSKYTGKQEIDDSMARAWLHLINGAQKYIWIEQQYWIGSGQYFDEPIMELANQIPVAVADKVAQAIRNKKDFAAYVVIPLFPEGFPDSTVVQEILYFQSNTVQVMFRKVQEALKEVGSTADPTEYLHITFPAQRVEDPAGGIDSAHTIYVHAKHLIVDDSYTIIGSANVNDRSMAGDRDTEIGAVSHEDGAVLGADGKLPTGGVAKHRERLMLEHLGQDVLAKCADPSTADCRKAVKARTDENLALFMKPLGERTDLKSHLTSFPYKYDEAGNVSADPDEVPHMVGKMTGEPSTIVPDFTTTRRRVAQL